MTSVLLLAALASGRPWPAVTPGATRSLTQAEVCATRWGLDRRHVSDAKRRRVFRAYGIPWRRHRLYEVDHLVPRELGGADAEANLWPQRWAGRRGAHVKDRRENALHRAVCRGDLPLAEAQAEMRAWGRR